MPRTQYVMNKIGNHMPIYRWLKVFLRSGSRKFANDYFSKQKTNVINQYFWHEKPIHYRPGTSDTGIIYDLLLRPINKREYQIPTGIKPKVIFDIGANIGVATRLLKHHFPDATIFAFEPMPDNFSLLQKNTEQLTDVYTFPFGLAQQSGRVNIFQHLNTENHGGFSIHQLTTDTANQLGVNQSAHTSVEVQNPVEFCTKHNIQQIDLIKIDCEGAEHEILTNLPATIIAENQAIIGELHGIKNEELLDFLKQSHTVNANIAAHSTRGKFFAMNKKL